MKLKSIEMIGKKIGYLTVVKEVEPHYYPSGRHDKQYLCKCDCNNMVTVLGIHLRSKHTTSCGCARIENTRKMATTHNMSNTRLYNIWKNMKQRCYNPNRLDSHVYYEKGISVCEEWKNNFELFYNWSINNGYNDSLTIDRINNNLGYEPTNCRWVTQKEQCNNYLNRNINLTYNGETHTLKEWSEILNLSYSALHFRIIRGWDKKLVLSVPIR